jgi:hypothetical protein
VAKTALTGAALAATAWSRALEATLNQADEVPVEGDPDPPIDPLRRWPRPSASSRCCSG